MFTITFFNLPGDGGWCLRNIIDVFTIHEVLTVIDKVHETFTGYRVAKRRHSPGRIGPQHCLHKEDAIKWFQTKYEGIILPGKKK